MADENIISGKKYKVFKNGIWKIFSFFTKASDVEFDDGMNAEEKIQDIEDKKINITDIVDSTESTATNLPASANSVNTVKNMLGDQVTYSLSGTTLTITTK